MKLRKLLNKLEAAQEAVRTELQTLYPLGSKWFVKLRYGQVNPSIMTVIGHPGGVYGYVTFEKPKKRKWKQDYDTFFLRDVSPQHILGPAD